MDKTTILVLLCLASCCAALEVGIYGQSSRTLIPGQGPLTLVCHVDEGLSIMLRYELQWVHVSLVDPSSPVETIMTIQETLKDEAPPLVFAVKFNYNVDTLNNTLTIQTVDPKFDGKFVCRAVPLKVNGDNDVEAEVSLIVVSDVQSIEMMFDGEDAVTGEDPTPVQREQGDGYGVTCYAKGFNPSATIHMFLGEDELTTTGTEIMFDPTASQDAEARRYMTSASATNVQLTASDNGKKLSCQAKADYAEDAATLVASVPLTVISLEPTIVCDKNVSAWEGDKYVEISCEVHHQNVEIERYSWEIGSTGEIINPGDSTDDHDEVSVVEDPENHKSIVTLDLYEVFDWHFQSAYYLDVYVKGGQKFRETVMIIKNESTGGATSVVVSHSAVFFLCFCLSALLSL